MSNNKGKKQDEKEKVGRKYKKGEENNFLGKISERVISTKHKKRTRKKSYTRKFGRWGFTRFNKAISHVILYSRNFCERKTIKGTK